ncbi:sigma-54-dependent Fis family transcriptional regulator [Pseudomonas sp. TE3610]
MLPGYSRAHEAHVSRVLRTACCAPDLPVPDLILQSWRRAIEHHHLDPGSLHGPRIMDSHHLREHRQRVEDFLGIAGDELARLHMKVRHGDYCVMLAHVQGCTIDYRVDGGIARDCRRAGMDLGTCWSEGEEGTCGVSQVILNQVPVTVHKRDHFRAAFIDLTCSAAPIFAPDGQLLAVLDVSAIKSPDDRNSQQLLRHMVIQSARDIENAYFMHSTQGCWRLRAHAAPGYVDSQPDLLLAWDEDGRVTAANASARRYLVQRLGSLPQHFRQAFDADTLFTHAMGRQHFLADHGLYVRLEAPRQTSQGISPNTRTQVDTTVHQALQKAVRVKDRDLHILLHGETGCGKEHFARALHCASARRDRPFIAVNCAALPESLIESELFGYVPGAFTGASAKGKRGLVGQANTGTLFLDEIGDMPLTMQTRLLRVLSEGEISPLGAAGSEKIDVQVICASHRDLHALVQQGQFREDLYFRLSGARFDLPALRNRTDKLNLINQYLAQESQRTPLPVQLSDAALERLLTYPWPGNIRELHHALRYASALSQDGTLRLEDLPAALQAATDVPAQPSGLGSPERQALIDVLVRNRWKPLLAAREMGISRATLYRKVNQHGIRMPGKGSYERLA